MFAQKTVWSSGELSATPSKVMLILLPAAPRMRIAAVPVPSPFSPQANTPGVCERRKGSSRPLFENASSSVFLILETAYGALFGARTPATTTSSRCCCLSVSVTVCAFIAATHVSAAVNRIILFISQVDDLRKKYKGVSSYAGIIRIRSMGIISASPNRQAPLSFHSENRCKSNTFLSNCQK